MATTSFIFYCILLVIQQGLVNSCKIDFEKVGCYRDVSRSLSELITTDRDLSDTKHTSGLMFDWNDFEGSARSLICRCAALARSKGYRYIGIQFYAECWGGNKADFMRGGESENCTQNYSTFGEVVCNFDSPDDCVGMANTNFVYDLLDCWEIVDVAVQLDVSNSMSGSAISAGKAFIVELTKKLTISRYGAHIGLVSFASSARVEFDFKSSLNNGEEAAGLQETIDGICNEAGATLPDKAFSMTDSYLFTDEGGVRSDVPRFVITITDGALHQDSVITPIMTSLKVNKGAHLLSVGVGSVIQQDLNALAMNEPDNVFDGNQNDAAQTVASRIEAIAKNHCSQLFKRNLRGRKMKLRAQ